VFSHLPEKGIPVSGEKELRKTPLYEKHSAKGAHMVPFAGWSMPVQYTGIIEEHLHTRSKAGLFDICHMGEFIIKGPDAESDLERLLTCRIDTLKEGRCRYGFLLNETGGIIDDMIIFHTAPEEFMMVVNAGTLEKDSTWIRSCLSRGTVFEDISDKTAKIDLQGPLSAEIMDTLIREISSLGRFSFTRAELAGTSVIVSRTGYTGEDGFEIFSEAREAGKLWDMFEGFREVKPAGLGARDSLRLEMGYSLYGHDIDALHTPFEANLNKFVHMEKDFIGKPALAEQSQKGFSRILTGFICQGRRTARENYRVISDANKEAGRVTSGAFSPCLKRGIGLCYIDKNLVQEGQEIILANGAVEIQAEIKNPPFVE